MNKIIKQSEPVKSQKWGKKSTVDLYIGPRHHRTNIEITVKAATGKTPTLVDVLGLINITMNGKAQRTALATEIDAINTLMGSEFGVLTDNGAGGATAPGGTFRFRLPIFWSEPWRKGWLAQELRALFTSWPGYQLNSFQMEMGIPDASDNIDGATDPIINVYCLMDMAAGALNANGQPENLIVKWLRVNEGYNAAGLHYITKMQRRQQYESIHFFTDTDTITNMRVNVDSLTLRDCSKTINDDDLVRYGMNYAGLSSTRFDLVFDMSDLFEDGLVMQDKAGRTVQNFELIPTMSGHVKSDMSIVSLMFGPMD